MKIIRSIYDWMGTKVHSKYADWWLIALFFIESSVFIIPVDPLLILFCIENNKKSFYYATISTLSSVVGGLFGYFIGAVLWQSIGVKLVTWLISEATFYELVAKYKKYQVIAVLIAGFAPVPYKAVTISAGFCHLPLVPFTFYSFVARGGRFFLIAAAIKIWGEKIKVIIDRYFNQLVVLFVLLVIFSCWVLK
jgi:membrane protein YqaA with SNARE-associated domain